MRPATTNPKPKLFLDSSALISAVISPSETTPIQRILMLGEAGVLDLRISREVIGDVERFVRARKPDILPKIAQIIDRAGAAITAEPAEETIAFCEQLTGYRPDARILAAAMECAADVLVTYDSTHLLGNSKIAPPDTSILVQNPKDCLEWCYHQWLSRSGA